MSKYCMQLTLEANVSTPVSRGDPVYWSGNDTIGRASSAVLPTAASAIGVAAADQPEVGQSVVVVRSGIVLEVSFPHVVRAGEPIWMHPDGGLTKYT
jgi:hypothetical protein